MDATLTWRDWPASGARHYFLTSAEGCRLWWCRVYNTPAGRAEAQAGLRTFARQHGLRVVDSRGTTLIEPPEVEAVESAA